MAFDIRPADVFADVSQVIGPKNPDSNVCWCLSYRLPSKENNALHSKDRGKRVKKLCAETLAPGVLAYDGDKPVGWAGVAPRKDLSSFARANNKIPHLDDLDDVDVWTVWCFRTKAGNRGRGIGHALLEGAVEFAKKHKAPVIEGYPVDNKGKKVNLTMAYVGTRSMFETAGFEFAAKTESTLDRFPRVVMRRELG